ncbi:MAG: TIGR01777 family protein [Chloroflexi bacterium]|nr:TIGR01777 family protein [Chloroflexota bacterium]|tara:strand:+ start:227 stop:1114 length:888 start_codon:yes stop_codon:yes gene_type:complete
MNIAISGSNGLIGTELKQFLENKGESVTAIVRDPNQKGILWNPINEDINLDLLEGFDCIINLNGEKIDRLLPISNNHEIKKSRILSAKTLSISISQLKYPPKVFLSASGFGFYGDRGDQNLTEESLPGTGFLSQLAIEWENSASSYITPNINTRVILMRFGLILSRKGGILPKLNGLGNLGLGKMFGSGSQFWPWISIEDTILGIYHAIENPVLNGPINFVSPQQTRNKEFMKIFAKYSKKFCVFPIPKFLISNFTTDPTRKTLLNSTKILPEKLLSSNFKFKLDTLEKTFMEYY